MGPAAVVEADVAADPSPGLGDAGVGPQVDLLVFDGPPEALHEDVVAPGALAIHTDPDLAGGQNLDEVGGRELATLIAVEDLGRSVSRQCLLDSFYAEVGLHRDRYQPCQDPSGEPVHDRGEVDEAPRRRDVGDVHRPDLVGPDDGQLPQQIGIDLVPRCRFRGVGLSIQGFYAHALHQRGDVQPPDPEPFLDEQTLQHPVARERELHVQLVDPVHQLQIGIRNRARLVVDAAPADPQHDRLAADAQLRGGIDHFLALGNRPALPSAPDKKSFSSVSSPIFACRVFTSITGSGSAFKPSPNTPVAPSSSWSRHCLIWFGWTSKSCASSIRVFSPLIAATATFALNAGLWFRRGRLAMVFSSLAASCCHGAKKTTYPGCSDFRNHLCSMKRRSDQKNDWAAIAAEYFEILKRFDINP